MESAAAGFGTFETSTNNVALLTGAGTRWNVSGEMSIGRAGADNRLLLASGAALQAGTLYIGNQSSRNRLLLQGLSGVRNDSLFLGASSNANDNELQLDGIGANWTNLNRVTLGDSGSNNRLLIRDGAVFQSSQSAIPDFTMGRTPFSRGNELLVSGAGSALRGTWSLTIGFSGSANRLTALDGARLQTTAADVGESCLARDNVAFLSGPGTVWSNGMLQVGFCSTNNHLVISNGARVFATLVRSSVQGGASNGITVAGPDSLLRATGDLIIGNSGAGNYFSATDGARVEGRTDRIGWSGGGQNAAFLHDAGTTWSNLSLTIGLTSSSNQLLVAGGARLQSGSAMLGTDSMAVGNSATVSGFGSAWNVSSNLVVGGVGRMNRLVVTEGATVSTRHLWLGGGSLVLPTALFNSDSNIALIEGSNTLLNASGVVLVGGYGRFNRMELRHGARVTDAEGIVGFSSSSRSNAVLVTGAGSSWIHGGRLLIGSNGVSSELTIADGGRVVNGEAFLGVHGVDLFGGSACFGVVESLSQVSVSGPESIWENRGTLEVGYGAGGNRLNVTDGGTVLANGLVIGGVRQPRAITCPPVTNFVLINGGCLVVTNHSASAVLEPRFGALVLQSGVVEADRFLATNDANRALVFSGGTLRIREGLMEVPAPAFSPHFLGDGTHSATLMLEHGTLAVGTGLIMAPNAVVSGDGLVSAAPFTVRGTIAPGDNGPGRLSLLGNQFAMDDFASLALDIAGTEPGVTYDQFVTDNALFAGYLDIRLGDGFIPQSNDVFEVVKFAVNGNGGTFDKSLTAQQRVFTVDRLGSFRLQRNATNFVLTDYRSSDGDGDGIEDSWATNAFGHTPLSAAERAADADGDGASNLDEFKEGTDPKDAGSVFRVAWVEVSPKTLQWRRVRGKFYRVWHSEDLASWHAVVEPTFNYTGDSCTWADEGKGTGVAEAATRFYRVSVE